MDIRFLDKKYDTVWERFYLRMCGLDYDKEYYWDKSVLTREIFETFLDDIIDKIIFFKEYINNPLLRPRAAPFGDGWWVLSMDDIHIGYQILGILILQTGSYLPKIVLDSILYSTRWDYDKQRGWTDSIVKIRRENFRLNPFNHHPT